MTVDAFAELRQVESDIAKILDSSTPLGAYMAWATEVQKSPAIYHLCCGQTMVLHELGRRGFILQGNIPLTLWTSLVGSSATGKSSVIKMALRFLREAWTEYGTDAPDTIVELEGTVPGILDSLCEKYEPGRGTTAVLGYHHELARIFGNKEPVSEALCMLHDGETFSRNIKAYRGKKKSGKPIDRVIQPRVCGIFATTEAQLAPYFGEAQRIGGIFSRLWWANPTFGKDNLIIAPPWAGNRLLDTKYVDALRTWAGWMAQLSMVGAEHGNQITISEDAWQLLLDGLFLPFKESFRADDDMNAVKLRLVEKVQVIAAANAVERLSMVVERQDMQRAIYFGEELLQHAYSVSGLGSSPSYRMALRLERMLLGAGSDGLNRKDIYTKLRIGKKDLTLAIETLLDKEAIVVNQGERSGTTRFIHADTIRGEKIRKKSSN